MRKIYGWLMFFWADVGKTLSKNDFYLTTFHQIKFIFKVRLGHFCVSLVKYLFSYIRPHSDCESANLLQPSMDGWGCKKNPFIYCNGLPHCKGQLSWTNLGLDETYLDPNISFKFQEKLIFRYGIESGIPEGMAVDAVLGGIDTTGNGYF